MQHQQGWNTAPVVSLIPSVIRVGDIVIIDIVVVVVVAAEGLEATRAGIGATTASVVSREKVPVRAVRGFYSCGSSQLWPVCICKCEKWIGVDTVTYSRQHTSYVSHALL